MMFFSEFHLTFNEIALLISSIYGQALAYGLRKSMTS